MSSSHLDRLVAIFREMPSVLVCYSGGIDSALVLAVAHQTLGDRAVGMTAVSPSLADFEREDAIRIAKQIGARHELVESTEIDDPAYQANNADRCFHCKSELYRVSARKQAEWQVAFSVNGTNLDDLGDYRPGLEAAKQAGVRSPLIEASMTKADVRAVAKEIGLGVWDKPAAACLSSRLPYGTRVTRDRLSRIGTLEAALKQLGFARVRVRFHPLATLPESAQASSAIASTATPAPLDDVALARIEVDAHEMEHAVRERASIAEASRAAGFAFVTLDLVGYRTGSNNELLKGKSLPVLRS